MLNKRHNSVITLSIFLTLVGLSKPAKAFLVAQADAVQATFTVPEELPKDTKVEISASNSTSIINEGLKDGFTTKYPNAKVNVATQSAEDALNTLLEGKTDIVSIGRNLTAAEKGKGLVTVPISLEKIAIVISKNNSYNGNLTFEQFAKIFRGEITDWSEIGGNPGAIQLVDLPESNDTRQAFPNYSVFQAGEFTTGSNTTKVDEDSTEAMISQLGDNGISYAVAGDVIDRDDVKIVTMHQTLPDDPRYPFSQPFSLVYQGTPNEATSAFLGFATTEAGQKTLATRVGSSSAVQSSAIASDSDKVAQTDGDDSGKLNPNVDGSGDLNTDLDDSGKVDVDKLEGSGELNPELDGSGELNPELDGSGELNPDVKDSGELNSNANLGVDGNANSEINGENSEAKTGGDTVPDAKTNADGEKGVAVAAQKKWWWWLPLIIGIPLLGALAYKFIGGKGKSDQEPAIADVSDSDSSQESVGGFDPELNADTTKVSAGIGNVATNAVNTGSKFGGAALATGGAAFAGGAAAINKFGGISKSDQEDTDMDPDVELEDIVAQPEMNIDASINEIPSDPVSEFSGQETTLQSTEQSTKLQVDDFESNDYGLVDNISAIGGAAAVGGAAATTGFLGNDNTVEDDLEALKPDSGESNQSGFVSEQSTKLQTQDVEGQIHTGVTISSDEDLDNIESDASQTNLEFQGDFVLSEEGQNTELDIADDASSTSDDISWIDDVVSGNETTSSAQAFVMDEPAAESPDIGNSVVDKGSDLTDGVTQTGGAAIAGGAAAIGVAGAAASGLFTNKNQDQTTDINLGESNETNIETNWEDDIDNSETTSSAQAFVLETPEIISSDNQDTAIGQASGFIDNAAQTAPDSNISSSTTPFSGFFADEDPAEQNTEIDIDNINIDDTNWVDETSNSETTSSTQAFVLETPEFTTTDNQDTVIEQGSDFGRVDDVNWVDDVNLDFNNDSETLVESSENNLEQITNSADVSLDEITFDDSDSVSEATLEDITFDETISSNTLSLDEINFDDSDSIVEGQLEDITFDDSNDDTIIDSIDVDNPSNQEINLDDLGFATQSQDVSGLMGDQATEIGNTSSNNAGDINNISEWLDSLETPNKNTENISEWLDNLSADGNDTTTQDANTDNIIESESDFEDISFQFLEDLLERDSNKDD